LLAEGEGQPFSTDLNFARNGPGEFLHGRDSWK
jgi:hypothetical protein